MLISLPAPPLNFAPLNRKRTTSSALPSPLPLSPTFNGSHAHPSRLLTSPVVGEFKGWFSNIFGWRNQNGAGAGVLYSPDDIVKTCWEVGTLLQGLGVIVEGPGFGSQRGSEGAEEYVLKCQVEETTPIAGTHLSTKGLRFRVEFTASLGSAVATSPPNSSFLAAPSGPNTRARGSFLGPKSPLLSPLPSPNSSSFPAACSTAVMLLHEKGSMSTFRMVWKKLKGGYGEALAQYPCMSPAIASTPMFEAAPWSVAA